MTHHQCGPQRVPQIGSAAGAGIGKERATSI